MTFTLPTFPAKTTTALTTIPHFPENPKTLILQQCRTIKELNQVHAHLIKTSLHLIPSVAENLLESAALNLPQSTDYALSIFTHIDEPNSPAYNIMIRAFTLNQSPHDSILLFKQMLEKSVEPDQFTFPCVLKACSRVQAVKEGEQIHCQIVKSGFYLNGFAENTLINMYANCGKFEIARSLFDNMSEKTVVTWSSMFSGYTKCEYFEEVVKLFRKMMESNVKFNEITMVSVLTACGRLGDWELGKYIHEYITENELTKNPTLMTSLIDMYAKCGDVDMARRLFNQMTQRDVVAWSAMISGYSQSNRCREALYLFTKMQEANVEPNEVTMVSVLASCAVLGALETGKWVHFYIKKKKLKLTVTLGTALVDFYSKCGSIENSVEVFMKMPFKNVLSWTVLIQGLANNGQGKRALEFFNFMSENGMKPNDVTFIGVLSACSHAGLVDLGRDIFKSISRDYDLEPKMEHYGCMVDILSRAGLIKEAYQFIQNMPTKPNAVIWRTLLASCKVHKNVEIGEESFKQICILDTTHSGDYILLSNIYVSVGKWEEALRVRNLMKEKGIKKTPGCSLIELDGEIHEFFAEDNKHRHIKMIYNVTEKMIKKIKLGGYVPNTEEARIDAGEDDKETSVSHHSEKLAIAFGLIRTSKGATIRITKNLRVCNDCHDAMKITSKVFEREIVVRDRNRFHHFKEGSCSCNDYW